MRKALSKKGGSFFRKKGFLPFERDPEKIQKILSKKRIFEKGGIPGKDIVAGTSESSQKGGGPEKDLIRMPPFTRATTFMRFPGRKQKERTRTKFIPSASNEEGAFAFLHEPHAKACVKMTRKGMPHSLPPKSPNQSGRIEKNLPELPRIPKLLFHNTSSSPANCFYAFILHQSGEKSSPDEKPFLSGFHRMRHSPGNEHHGTRPIGNLLCPDNSSPASLKHLVNFTLFFMLVEL